MRKAVFFRGRHTTEIIKDALAAGIVSADHEIVVICRKNDAMASPGDVVSPVDVLTGDTAEVVLVANGGTTAQLVPVLVSLLSRVRDEPSHCGLKNCSVHSGHGATGDCYCDCDYCSRSWSYKVYDIQRDGVSLLAQG